MAYENNSNLAAAIAGFAIATEDRSSDENAGNRYNGLQAGQEENYNDASEKSISSDESLKTDVDLSLKDAFKDASAHDSYNDVTDDSSTHTDVEVTLNDAFKETSISDSYNNESHTTDKSSNTDISLSDSFKDASVNNSYNPETTTNNVNVGLQDALNDKSVTDSHNNSSIDNSLKLNIEDAFNPNDSDWLDLDGVQFDAMSLIKDALNGNGDNQVFTLNQISEMTDNDTLNSPSLSNSADWSQEGTAWGGEADGLHARAPLGSDNGDDGNVTSTATSEGASTLEAFTQNISLGANIQYNSMHVVGGDTTGDAIDNG